MESQFLTQAATSIKIKNSLFSLAMCDALGGPAEFHQRGTFPLVTEMIRNENFNLALGTWTDDTSMALCLSEAIINNKGKIPSEASQAELYVRWWRNGHLSAVGRCFDIGMATRTSLGFWEKEPSEALEKVKQKLSGGYSCGNGSLMRVLPVALAFWEDSENAMEAARKSSIVTHPHPMCQEACAIYVLLISRILQCCPEKTMSKKELLGILYGYTFKNAALRDAIGPTSGFTAKPITQIHSSGFVLHTLQAALWCFFNTDTFEKGAIEVVNLGDDADTVAAVYGGLAGAWYADSMEIKDSKFWSPRARRWWEELVEREVIEEIADRLLEFQSNS